MWRASLVLVASSSVAFAQGAVPVPEDGPPQQLLLNERDTSVTIGELPPLTAKWKSRAKIVFGGVVPIALCHSGLYVIGPVHDESGYPGSLEQIPLVPIGDAAANGSCFPAVDIDYKRNRSKGPIHAAIRVRPTSTSPESERFGLVLYNPPQRQDVMLVAMKPAGETAWVPLLRVDMPRATRFNLLDPGWH